jgi:hypothetical protein
MELKHGVVLTGKPWNEGDTEPAVQEHLDSHVADGWTLASHSTAAYVDVLRGTPWVVYSFVRER